jgi:iron complex outermembrane receptor protein
MFDSRCIVRLATRLCGALLFMLAGAPLGVPAPLRASEPTPALSGVVQDEGGQPIANAQVIVAQLHRVATTSDAGRFRFTGLPAGTYHLSVTRLGFAAAHADVTVPERGADVQVTVVMHRAAVQLTGVEVTATPVGADPRDVPQAVTSLSGAELSRQVGSSLAQTLAGEPGVAVRFNGSAASAPVIRGLQGERILVLQDGNRAGDLSSSAPDHGTSIDPLTAERIEVVRGPASLLYGNQALGGVVNVISNDIPTSIPTHVDGYVATDVQSVSAGGGVAAGVTVPLNASLALVARGGARRTGALHVGGGSTLENSHHHNIHGEGGIGFGTNRVTGGVVYRGYRFDYGLPSADEVRATIDGHRHELAGRVELATNNEVVSSLRASATAQWYSHAELDQGTGATNTSFDLRTQTVDLLGRTLVGPVSGAIGASGLFRQYSARGDEALTPAANSSGVGVFVFQELPFRATDGDPDARVPKLQVGGRVDSYRIDLPRGDPKFDAFVGMHRYDQFSGSIGVNLPVGEHVTGALSVARAFRAPSVEELASNAFHEATGTFDVGNPGLASEVNEGGEAILRVQSRRVNGSLSAFANLIRNYITPNVVGDTIVSGDAGPASVPLNHVSQADARMHGVEGQLEAEVINHVVLGAMGDLVRGEFRSTKVPLPYMPAARLGALVRWDNGTISAGTDYRHAFAQQRVPPSTSADDAAAVPSAAYDLVNLAVGYNASRGSQVHSIMLRVDNLFDERYADATSRIKAFAFNPGRNFALVYRVEF